MWLRCGAVIALALTAAPAFDNLTRPVPPATASRVVARARVLGAPPAMPWPDGAQAAVGAGGFGVLASTPGARPLPTASVAKVMTALVTLEQRPLRPGEPGPVITVTEQNVSDYADQVARNGSVVPVVVGEQLTERQALEALLLPSANNVAIMLARWTAGSLPAFVAAMNDRARQLAMTQTTFTDPSGLDPLTVSVPEDLVRLGQQAMADPAFAQIVAEQTAVIPVAGTISNVNGVLGRDGIVGIKTGNSVQARAVYLAAATYRPAGAQPLLVYAAVQGLDTLEECFAAAQRLVAAIEGALRVQTIVGRGELLARYAAAWGAAAELVAGADVQLLVWPGTAATTALRAPALHAPARAGSAVGALAVSASGHTAAVPARLAGGLAGPSQLWLLTRSAAVSTLPPMLLTWLSLTLAVAAVLLALAALLRGELRGPNVRLRLISAPAPDAWHVAETSRVEVSGACVALLANTGSHAGAAWDFRVAVTGPQGPCEALAAALPEVVQVEPRSSVGLVVTVRLPLDGPNVEAVLPALRRSAGDLTVSVSYGATQWPWGRPVRRSTALAIPQADLTAAVERWTASRARVTEPESQGWVPPKLDT